MADSTKQIKELLMDKERFNAMCKSIFDEMDKDKGGFIDSTELEAALTKMSKKNGVPPPSKKDIQDTMKIFDKSKDGKIQLDEFIAVTRESYEKMVKNDLKNINKATEQLLMEEKNFMSTVNNLFKTYDSNGNGTMESGEVGDALTKFAKQNNKPVPQKAQIDTIVKKYDVNKDKTIGFDEFLKMVKEVFGIVFAEGKSDTARTQTTVNNDLMDESRFITLATSTFKQFDKKNDGSLDGPELPSSLEFFSKQANLQAIAKPQVEALTKKYEAGKDKKVNFDTFVKILKEGFNLKFAATTQKEPQTQPQSSSRDVQMSDSEFMTLVANVFKQFDKKADNQMDGGELSEALAFFAKQLNRPSLAKNQVDALVKKYDVSKDKNINLDEFAKIVKEGFNVKVVFYMDEDDFAALVQNTFKLFDKKGDGVMESGELTDALNHFSKQSGRPTLAKTTIETVSKKHDVSKDKKINLNEFIPLVKEAYEIVFKPKKPEKDYNQERTIDPNDPRAKSAEEYLRYVEETGLSMAFKIIFTEILSKKIPEDKVFAYTATRLRQIGEDIAYIQNSKYRKAKY